MRGVCQSELHLDALEDASVPYEYRLVSVLFPDSHLQVPLVRVKSAEVLRVAQ